MKISFAILAMTMFSISWFTGCTPTDTQGNDDLITVDVTKNYPKKEMILQDFLDVEYVVLETNDEFLTQGFVQAVGERCIVAINDIEDGNIFIFDREGKAVRKINRWGQGSEEYSIILRLMTDEGNNEMFINDYYVKKISVYDLSGNYMRSFTHNATIFYDRVYNFDKDHLICHEVSGIDFISENLFSIISKQDGHIVKRIQIPYEEKKTTMLKVDDESKGMAYTIQARNEELIPGHDGWLLAEPSADTIYKYRPDYSKVPLIARTPSIHSMEPEKFLFPGVHTDQYIFLQTVKREYDFAREEGFPRTDLVYDKQENAIFECVVYNGDFMNKIPISLVYEYPMFTFVNSDEIAFVKKLEAFDLVEAYEKGQLKGKLKEIAATLNEESNPVIMLAKYKK
jgi:hypothetical protein